MHAEAEREYAEFLKARLPRLHRTAYLLCGDADRAEDIVQATALALYLKWERIRTVDNTDGYLHRMLVREFFGQQRLSWAKVLLTNQPPERIAPPSHDIEERDAVTTALAQLAPGQRAVLVLRFFCDLSIDATAAALNCSPGNVKSQTNRGLATLRRLMCEPALASEKGADCG
jgi:RNA polymerase sigma-70 factor (sigma-E family)